jgi:hypothetical protein
VNDDIRNQVAKEIAAAIMGLDPPGGVLTGDKALGFYCARAMATAIANAHAVEGGLWPRDMVDIVTGGGL